MNLNGTGLDLSEVADELLLELCATDDYIIEYETGETSDQVTGVITPGVTVQIPLDSGLEDTTSFGLIEQSNIQAGDIFLMISPKVTIPAQEYYFLVRGVKYSIVNSKPFYNTGVLQYGEYQLRSS